MSNDQLVLHATQRQPHQKVAGVKGVVYGKEQPSVPLEADYLTLDRLYQTAGHNRLVDLEIGDDKPVKVLFKEVVTDPRTNKINHFDLHAISMKEKIQADVPVIIEGESALVISGEGILSTVTDTVSVESEPLSLPEKFTIDISGLTEINDNILVGDLTAPAGVEILSDPELVLVKIDAPAEEEVEEEPEEAEAGEEGETGKEGEETTEGEDGEKTESDQESGESKSDSDAKSDDKAK